MRYFFNTALAVVLISLSACKQENPPIAQSERSGTEKAAPIKKSKAQVMLSETIEAHGGALYEKANYSFTFRDKAYTFKNDYQNYTYQVTANKDNQEIIDILENGDLSRSINKTKIILNVEDAQKYREALNSVIYFATLPHKLNDPAVNLSLEGEANFKDQAYNVLKVTFNKEGGGEDYDDQYHYWINKNSKKIDFLAYNYTVNGGGVRFRAAYNTRLIDGITFQDYINYKAEIGTPLIDLLGLHEKGALKELSRIETENITNLNQ